MKGKGNYETNYKSNFDKNNQIFAQNKGFDNLKKDLTANHFVLGSEGQKESWITENKSQFNNKKGLAEKYDVKEINNRLKYNSFKLSNEKTN